MKKHTSTLLSIVSLMFLLSTNTLTAQITLPSLFNDNMVLQQNFQAPIWGWAEPGTEIVVSGNWSRMPARLAIADKDGKWMVKLTTLDPGGPYQVYINDRTIDNVMIGEVWVCSGQSNMQWALDQSEDGEAEIENAEFPAMRLFYVARDNADEPSNDCYGKWVSCDPESAKTFSAVAYYFGKEIHKELNVPVGLIHTSWGGSTAEAWTNYNVLQSTPEGQFYIEKYRKKIEKSAPGINPRNHQSPSGLYNAMLHPLIPFGIRGAIWYQGEANTQKHTMYKNLQETMVTNWREEWNQGDFPFYFVQLAPFNYQQDFIGAALRDAQRRSLEIPNSGMVVTLDIGNPDDIHPLNKHDVGHRLALWALAITYGNDDLVYSGPLYKSMEKDGKKIILNFDNIGSGLLCKGEKLTHFTMAGENKVFYPAYAEIENNTVIVSSKKVKNPQAVRFAFNNGDEPNFFNQEGLPASTFRTDDWRIITETPDIESEFDNMNKNFVITIESESKNEIRYTIDGNEPTYQSTLYTGPFTITQNVIIKAKAFVNKEPSLLLTETKIEKHLATGKNVTYKTQYHERYTAGGDMGLVNSIFGSSNFSDGNWQGFPGKDLEVVIDLDGPTNISSVSVSCLQLVNSWIVFPKQLEIYSSEDGENFNLVSTKENEISVSEKKALIQTINARFETVETRYVKVIAKNFGPLPDWHSGAGNDSWLFADEITIN